MNVTDFPGLQRRPDTQEIDIKGSLRVFAEKVITLKAEEAKLRNMRRFKDAVLKVFAEGHGFRIRGYYDEKLFFHLEPLITSVVNKLRHKKSEEVALREQVKQHILLNHKRYLFVRTFQVYGQDTTHVLLK